MKAVTNLYRLFLCLILSLAANPLKALDEFSFIEAGEFVMGNSVLEDTDLTETPTRTVILDGFYMGKFEVTKAQWDEVLSWALSNGYAFDNGVTDKPSGEGKYSDHPVQMIAFYDILKWCNARSEKEGLTPVYYTNDAQTAIYKTGSVDVTNAQVKWSANGYRLPTEAEWEKAARARLSGKRFPWGDTISHSQASYYASKLIYDATGQEGTIGYPQYLVTGLTGLYPYTSPAGSLQPNDYGLYDMAGNVYEWCWDRFAAYDLNDLSNPRGPNSGTSRILRGGAWNDTAAMSRVARRLSTTPIQKQNNIGFRLAFNPAIIRGWVTGPDDTAYDKATAQVYKLNANGRWEPYAHMKVNPDGAYQIGVFPKGTYRVGFFDDNNFYSVQFHRDTGSTMYFEQAQDIVISSPETKTEVNGKFNERAATIAGNVKDKSGAPLHDVRIEAYRRDGQDWRRVLFYDLEAIDNGLFDLSMLPVGTYRFKFEKDGFVTSYNGNSSTLEGAQDIVLGEDRASDSIDMVLLTYIQSRITSDLSDARVSKGKAITPYKVTTSFGANSYAVKKLPPGLKFNTKTGVISGIPKKRGTYAVVITASLKKGKKTLQKETFVKVFVVS
jgi:formylglycine-generating enzyme required for sulfatase activity/5-hydroxyisourate hydrolase-like protein (transthyretin family)